MDLGSKARHGVKWTTLSTAFAAVSGILQLAILTRLLDKQDFGLFASLSVVLGLGAYFVEAGMGGAAIHVQNASEKQLGTAYAINIIFGVLAFLVVTGAAPAIAVFYEDVRLEGLVRLGAFIFLIQPFGLQYFALLQRDFKFSLLAKVELLNSCVTLVASLVLAKWIGGAESLAGAMLLAALVRTSCLLFLGIRAYGFRFSFSRKEAGFFFRFGAFQIGEGFVNYANSQLDVVLIGKLLGQDAVGGFYVAKQLVFKPMQIINPIVTRVYLPVFAKLQNEPGAIKEAYLKLVRSLAGVHAAIYFCMAVFADLAVRILFGAHWGDSVPLIQILSLYVFLRALINPVGSLQVALGRVSLGFYWNLGLFFFIPVTVYFGAMFGQLGVAVALAVSMLVLHVPAWFFLVGPLSGASFSEYFEPFVKVACVAALCFAWLFLVESVWVRIAMFGLGACLYYIALRRFLLINNRKPAL